MLIHLFFKIFCNAVSVSSSSNLLHCFPTLAIKRFFLMSEPQLMLQLRGVPSPCAAGLLHLPLQTRLPPWAAQHAACLFCKGTTSTSASNSVFPFFCSYVWLFLPCSSPYRIIFLPDIFFQIFQDIFVFYFGCQGTCGPSHFSGFRKFSRYSLSWWNQIWNPLHRKALKLEVNLTSNLSSFPQPKRHWLKFFF